VPGRPWVQPALTCRDKTTGSYLKLRGSGAAPKRFRLTAMGNGARSRRASPSPRRSQVA